MLCDPRMQTEIFMQTLYAYGDLRIPVCKWGLILIPLCIWGLHVM